MLVWFLLLWGAYFLAVLFGLVLLKMPEKWDFERGVVVTTVGSLMLAVATTLLLPNL